MKFRQLAVFGAVALVCSFAVVARSAETGKERYERAKPALEKAKLTLEQGVEAAMKKVPEGKAVEAETKLEQGRAIFEVEMVSGTEHREVRIDAATGEVLSVEEQPESRKNKRELEEEKTENEAATTSKTTLAEAIQIAREEVKNGKAFDVCFHRRNGKLAVGVELFDGSMIKAVHIDPQTGKVLEVKEESIK
jgi:uncharacterized membrane protein YkoI